MSQNGKGDKQRPKSVDYKTWEKNWYRIFKPEHKKENDYRKKT
jgi:hypothetical protein